MKGHGFSRADKINKINWALAPEGRLSGFSSWNKPFSAACSAPEGLFEQGLIHPAEAKAVKIGPAIGTAEVVPFQNSYLFRGLGNSSPALQRQKPKCDCPAEFSLENLPLFAFLALFPRIYTYSASSLVPRTLSSRCNKPPQMTNNNLGRNWLFQNIEDVTLCSLDTQQVSCPCLPG